MLGNSNRPTCCHSWTDGGVAVSCERYAIVTVDGGSYCETHVGAYTDITQYD